MGASRSSGSVQTTHHVVRSWRVFSDCQSGVWSLAATFENFVTTHGTVDAICVAGGDPNPPNYNYA
ncbi:hypothetical protein, partial [Burkholderia cenocepacia]|uniref:hypothetical protein n=1 Tax=Burkholderia cenocepacia TaxID=95486 RepID=UPI001C404293